MRAEVAGRGNEWLGQLHIFAMLIAVSIPGHHPQHYRRYSDGDCDGQHRPWLPARSPTVLVEGLHRLEAAKALGEETIVAFLVDARKH